MTRQRSARSLLVGAVVLALTITGAGCGTDAQPVPESVRIVVPNPPGGGFDLTARVVGGALEEAALPGRVTVVNLTGELGMTALTRVLLEEGEGTLLLQMGLGMVANAHTRGRADDLAGLTPVAMVLQEAEAVMVARNSPYATLDDVVTDLRQRTGEVVVGGGSYPGGPDHQGTLRFLEGVGVDPAEVTYRPHDGGGEMLAELVSGDVDVAVAGTAQHLHQIRAGELRVLAVTGPERAPGIDAPTLRESGIDVEFLNWRGLLAPPGLSDDQRDALVEALDRARRSESWQEAVERHGWSDEWLTGDDFAAFLATEQARVGELLDGLSTR
ncbi:tripartite tricarboxylate transporter substrate binding protein [Nocardioides sp.]|uniref:Bug family tripartite tricarboxylate transporter substrate binding protein n=1 Tax=Nocardioides sp. TaxID=35761 RepID=UPI0027345915|nr:tripartite tricarboxylate transporter substrate binding protein [Nocardioides sp.]MDP3891000.1 tripartite tricarboxylate transporter substrate binding protein [Nocardioides sp.]